MNWFQGKLLHSTIFPSPFLSGLKSPHQSLSIKLAPTLFVLRQGFNEEGRNVNLGGEMVTMMCKFLVHASDATITKHIELDIHGCLNNITEGGTEYMLEDEKISAAISMGWGRFLSKNLNGMDSAAQISQTKTRLEKLKREEQVKKKGNVDENGKPREEPSTLSTLTTEEAEHYALLAAAVLGARTGPLKFRDLWWPFSLRLSIFIELVAFLPQTAYSFNRMQSASF